MADYFDALGQAYNQGYSYQDIAAYHADQGMPEPPKPDLAQLMQQPNLGAQQYNANIATTAYGFGNQGISDQDSNQSATPTSQPGILADPAGNAGAASPTQFQGGAAGVQPGDFPVPNTQDQTDTSGTAPWESQPGVAAPPIDQDI